ncbi:MAG: 8-amino-7-oxononanoate synthase [Ectothiorhodospiraceae bacterium]|nr:8-amino-7-oxononanoate synthase [Ectothiorhodospiraceae bacterium]
MDDILSPALKLRREQSLYRQRRVVDGPQSTTLSLLGRTVLNFCSNDYLGLANHPDVISALKKGADEYGVGSGAAHLINGHSRAHHALEDELADFVRRPRALLFSTGYMANQGVITSLVGKGDDILEDRINHASLIDAGRLSGARLQRYLHADCGSLETKLQKSIQNVSGHPRKLIATDGVFSMDGDLAPLSALADIASKHNAWLMVDDAHGFGVIGKQGRGTVDHFNLDSTQVPILMGTLGKAFGTFGAFVAGSEVFIETLIQQARSYIYTTALPPAVAEATRASLTLLRTGDDRREKLAARIKQFRAGAHQLGISLMDSHTPIQPLIVGGSKQAMAISETLLSEHNIMVSAIRPPTVVEGSARLRMTLCANHTETHVDQLLTALDASIRTTAA